MRDPPRPARYAKDMHDLTRLPELPDWPGAQDCRARVLAAWPHLAGDAVEVERRARRLHEGDVARERARVAAEARSAAVQQGLAADLADEAAASTGSAWRPAASTGGFRSGR